MAPIIISLNSCLYATSDDETQDVLCGVHIDEKYLFATDRFRIVRVPVDIPEAGKDLIGLTLPVKFVRTITSMDSINFNGFTKTDSKLVLFSGDKFTVSSTLLVGKFPKLNEFFPDMESANVDEYVPLIFPASIIPALERHASFQTTSESFDKATTVEVDDDKVFLKTVDKNVGCLDEKIVLEKATGKKVIFSINPIFLKDIVEEDSMVYIFEAKKLIYIQSEAFDALVKVRA